MVMAIMLLADETEGNISLSKNVFTREGKGVKKIDGAFFCFFALPVPCGRNATHNHKRSAHGKWKRTCCLIGTCVPKYTVRSKYRNELYK